jgi:aquaporin NIP
MTDTGGRDCIAEFLGTFCLVFAGTAAIVVNAGGPAAGVEIALTFGLVVFAVIAALGDVSGAHINPAVTVGFFLARRFPGRLVLRYVLSQCTGAIAASGVARLLFPATGGGGWGVTLPAGALWQSWVLEMLLTAGLMFVILNVSTGGSEKGVTAGLAVGAVVALEALCAGPICGASMNPARSLGPAVASLKFAALWVYLTAPVVGAALAVPVFKCVRDQE